MWRRPRSSRRTVVYLAIAAAAQAGISEEILIILAILVLVATIAAAVVMPKPTAGAVRRAVGPLLASIGIFVVLTAPMLVNQLFIARHVLLNSQRFRAVADDYLYSLTRQIWSTANGHHSYLGGAEDGVYLGWALIIAVLLGIMLTWRRDRLTRIAAIDAGRRSRPDIRQRRTTARVAAVATARHRSGPTIGAAGAIRTGHLSRHRVAAQSMD